MTSTRCCCCSNGPGGTSKQIVLEIGEHERLRDLDRLQLVLNSYREAGIRFALDDLGEGFSTIDVLTAVRAEYIKIARRRDPRLEQ